jgi:hypothetical protein
MARQSVVSSCFLVKRLQFMRLLRFARNDVYFIRRFAPRKDDFGNRLPLDSEDVLKLLKPLKRLRIFFVFSSKTHD